MPVTRTKPNAQLKGRAVGHNPPNRFEKLELEMDREWLETNATSNVSTEYLLDHSRSALAKNDSPDLFFDYSINPYRGCEHGCVYCYARPTHEYLGFSAGLDFETKIMVKLDAPQLLERQLNAQSWLPQVVAFSGNTDCYQPAERKLQITRRCLQVFLRFRNPVSIITKNALILRDLDILQDMAKHNLVCVTVSVTTLDHDLARRMEPRTSSPQRRLDALEKLTAAGIPVNINVAPIIAGLTDHELPDILQEASARGVKQAAYILLRLPHSVKDLYEEWLREHFPNRANKVMHAVSSTRDGRLNDPRFTSRMSGVGPRAELIRELFKINCRKYGLNKVKFDLATEHFRRVHAGQSELF